jgi:hypothetical protein
VKLESDFEKNSSVDSHHESSQDKIKMYLTSDLEGLQNVNELNKQKELVTDLMVMVQYFSQAMWDNKIYYPTQ